MLFHSTFRDQLEVRVDQRIDLGVITQIVHLRSCLCCVALKAIEGITVCAGNYSESALRTAQPNCRSSPMNRTAISSNLELLEEAAASHLWSLESIRTRAYYVIGVPLLIAEQVSDQGLGKEDNCTETSAELESARSAAESIPLRVTRDSSNSPVRNNGNVSGNMDCVLDVCEKGTVEEAAHRILIDQNRRQTRRPAASRNARPAAQTDASLKEKRPTTASAQGSEAEDEPFGRAVTELAPVGVHFSSTVQAPSVLPPVVHAMTHGENGKKRLVNCILDSASEKLLIRTNIADELELRGTPSMVAVRGVHVLSARVADSRHMRFQSGPPHEETAVSTKLELTALCISSICDNLIATLTPWPHEIDLHQAATLGTPPSLPSIYV
ncbi:hypothetical protein T08_12982 [Trichinella sp. T8]|nr:hypothetical protein T08_12982 [Trichinella sp. T8]